MIFDCYDQVYHFQVIRIQLEADTGNEYARARDVVSTVRKEDGIRGFYFGFVIGLTEIITKRALYLITFDIARSYFHVGIQEPPLWKKWLIAQGVSVLAGVVTYPLANIRHRMAVQAGKKEKKYSNSWHCAKTVFSEEGLQGFYGGVVSNIARGAVGAVVLLLHDFTKSITKK
jgi:solute carrier family 25 (adenine nucleotide translocator) protein 4/5/6/31